MNINKVNIANRGFTPPKKPHTSSSPFGKDEVTLGSTSTSQISHTDMKKILAKTKTCRLWKVNIDRLKNGLCIKNNSLFVADGKTLTKIDPKTGLKINSIKCPIDEVRGSAVVEGFDNTVIVNTGKGTIKVLDADSLKEVWSFDQGGGFYYPPSVSPDGTILTFKKEGDYVFLYRLDKDKNVVEKVKFNRYFSVGASKKSNFTVLNNSFNGGVLVAGTEKLENGVPEFAIYFIKGGKVVWRKEGEGHIKIFSNDPDHIYEDTPEVKIVRDSKDGNIVWKKELKKHPTLAKRIFTLANGEEFDDVAILHASSNHIILQGEKDDLAKAGYIINISNSNPERCLWKIETQGYLDKPLYAGEDFILHIKNREHYLLESVNPTTGKPMWHINLLEYMPALNQEIKNITLNSVFSKGINLHKAKKKIKNANLEEYSAKRGPKGDIYLKAQNQILIITPQGKLKGKAKSPVDIDDFTIDEENGMIYARNMREETLYGLSLEPVSLESSKEEVPQKSPSLTIEKKDEEVIIGRIKLKKHQSGKRVK